MEKVVKTSEFMASHLGTRWAPGNRVSLPPITVKLSKRRQYLWALTGGPRDADPRIEAEC